MGMGNKKSYRISEIANLFDICTRQVYRLINKGFLKKNGNFISSLSIKEYLSHHIKRSNYNQIGTSWPIEWATSMNRIDEEILRLVKMKSLAEIFKFRISTYLKGRYLDYIKLNNSINNKDLRIPLTRNNIAIINFFRKDNRLKNIAPYWVPLPEAASMLRISKYKLKDLADYYNGELDLRYVHDHRRKGHFITVDSIIEYMKKLEWSESKIEKALGFTIKDFECSKVFFGL